MAATRPAHAPPCNSPFVDSTSSPPGEYGRRAARALGLGADPDGRGGGRRRRVLGGLAGAVTHRRARRAFRGKFAAIARHHRHGDASRTAPERRARARRACRSSPTTAPGFRARRRKSRRATSRSIRRKRDRARTARPVPGSNPHCRRPSDEAHNPLRRFAAVRGRLDGSCLGIRDRDLRARWASPPGLRTSSRCRASAPSTRSNAATAHGPATIAPAAWSAGQRYRYRALTHHSEVIFWTVGTNEPSGKFGECTIQDGRNWVCKPNGDAARSITLQMVEGVPIAGRRGDPAVPRRLEVALDAPAARLVGERRRAAGAAGRAGPLSRASRAAGRPAVRENARRAIGNDRYHRSAGVRGGRRRGETP